MNRKCRECGCEPQPGETGTLCNVCFQDAVAYQCPDCTAWSSTDSCPTCRVLEGDKRRLQEAKARGDLAGALAVAQSLQSRCPGKREFGDVVMGLERARDALADCEVLASRPLARWKNVRKAQESLDEARAAFQAAGLAQAALGRASLPILEAEKELKGKEELARQAALAGTTAVGSALWAALFWSVAFASACLAGRLFDDSYVAYDRVKTLWCCAGGALLIAMFAQPTWGMTATTAGFVSGAFACLAAWCLWITPGYWGGLFVVVFFAAAVTVAFDAGIEPGSAASGVRKRVKNGLDVLKNALIPKYAGLVAIGGFALVFAAPTLHPPPPPLQPAAVATTRRGAATTSHPRGAPPVRSAPAPGRRGGPEPREQAAAVTQERASQPPKKGNARAQAASASEEVNAPAHAAPAPDRPATSPPPAVPATRSDNPSPPVSQPAAIPPRVRVASRTPPRPLEGGRVEIALAADSLSPPVRYEYRRSPDEPWRPASDGRITLSNLPPGELTVQCRCRDGLGLYSQVQPCVVEVTPLSAIPLTVSVADMDPPELLVGADVVIQLRSSRPSPQLYRFRCKDFGDWVASETDQIAIEAWPAGARTMQFCTADQQVGDISPMIQRIFKAELPRFEVMDLYRDDRGRPVVSVSDVQRGGDYIVGYGDDLAGKRVVHVDVRRRQLTLETGSGRNLYFRIPGELVTGYLAAGRTASPSGARSSARYRSRARSTASGGSR